MTHFGQVIMVVVIALAKSKTAYIELHCNEIRTLKQILALLWGQNLTITIANNIK